MSFGFFFIRVISRFWGNFCSGRRVASFCSFVLERFGSFVVILVGFSRFYRSWIRRLVFFRGGLCIRLVVFSIVGSRGF